jgi:hypothetical protein
MSALDVMRRVLTAYETHDLLGMEAHMQELRGAIEQAERQDSYWEEEARRYAGNADFWREKARARIECSRCGRILADVPPAPAGDTFAARWRNVTGAMKDLL